MSTSKKTPSISVIIPVWNPGPDISRCIESLRNQTLKDIEMIFVDDCGTDDSMDKVRVAAEEDSRIRIIENEKNIGSGPSRNRGIEAARGEYLSFVDPDDYVSLRFLELLYSEAKNKSFDIIKGSTIRKKEDGTVFPEEIKLNQIIANGLVEGHSLYCLFKYEHQSAIYRRDFIISNHILYGTSKRAQDNSFLLMACYMAKGITLIDEAHYYFCERGGSAMHTADASHLQGYLQAVSDQVQYVLGSLPNDKDVLLFLKNLFLNALQESWRYDCILDMKKESTEFVSDLHDILISLPYCDSLSDNNYSIRVLRDYCISLPRTPYSYPWEGKKSPEGYAKLAKCWTDFYLSHINEKDACKRDIIMIYNKAIRAVTDRSKVYYSSAERREGKKLLKEQMNRLPVSLRKSIKRSYLKHVLRRFI